MIRFENVTKVYKTDGHRRTILEQASFTLTAGGRPSLVRGRAANPLFDDSDPNRYFQPFVDAGLPRVGVKVAGVGVKIRVLQQSGTGMRIRVQ